jgi:thymidylate synthase ThyX
MIQAEVIQHSVSAAGGPPLITIVAEYPRFIHSEIMTHRVFSRNAASSRAIPVSRMLERVRKDPVVPLHWGANQPGMQAFEEIPLAKREQAIREWRRAAEHAAYFAEALNDLGVHKQIVNRLIEPFQWMKTIITATEWDNFFELRDHPDAEPHFQRLAKAIRKAINESTPVVRPAGHKSVESWHLPYVHDYEREAIREKGTDGAFLLARVSAARCARISYLSHDGSNPSLEKDMELFLKLAGGKPRHSSPLEHQAFPSEHSDVSFNNLVGWVQLRKIVDHPIVKIEGEDLVESD